MPRTSKTLVSWIAAVAALAASLCLSMTCTAWAVDGPTAAVYWANFGNDTISRANLAGGEGIQVPIASRLIGRPTGVAIDPRSGKIYWANRATDTISYASLDGEGGTGVLDTTGASVAAPETLAIDPGTNRIYWANVANNTIGFASLSGGGGGHLNTTGATIDAPTSVAVDPASNRIYWTSIGADTISYASLSGGGAADLNTAGAPVSAPEGVAVDPSTGRVYWTNPGDGTIGFASRSGGGGSTLDLGSGLLNEPLGIAIDPTAGRIYWANIGNDTIGFANLSSGGRGLLSTTGATLREPLYPILLKAPLKSEAPAVSGGHRAGSTLTCGAGWAGDISGAFLYQAPKIVEYEWLRNGRSLPGATVQTLDARTVGSYSCRVTATNFAGSTTESSLLFAINAALKLGKLRLAPASGTATLEVAAYGTGKLTLTGKGIKPHTTQARSKARLKIRPKTGLKKLLKQRTRVRARVKVTFLPEGGKPIRRSKTVGLKLKLSRR
jgi:DNA-binding beta-propeller fold protein YncE